MLFLFWLVHSCECLLLMLRVQRYEDLLKEQSKNDIYLHQMMKSFLDEEKRQVRGAIYTNLIKYMPIVSVGFIRIHTRLYGYLVPVFLRTT